MSAPPRLAPLPAVKVVFDPKGEKMYLAPPSWRGAAAVTHALYDARRAVRAAAEGRIAAPRPRVMELKALGLTREGITVSSGVRVMD